MPDFTDLDRLISRADPAATLPPPTVIPDPPASRSRRRAAGRSHPRLAVAGSVLAVVGAAVVVLLIAQFTTPSGPVPSGTGPVTLTTPPAPGPSTVSATQSETSASSGPEFLRAQRLLVTLRSVLPDGYTLPPMPTGDPRKDWPTPTGQPDSVMPPGEFIATREGGPKGWTGWAYDGFTDVIRNGRTGMVGVQVWTDVPARSGGLCSLVRRWYWLSFSAPTTCRTIQSGGKQVALTTRAGSAGLWPYHSERWASYRYPDGTLVIILQGRSDSVDTTPSLTHPVFTDSQLAALAVDPRFAS